MAAERPRVLVAIKGLGIGGAEKLISEGARFWDRSRFEYAVAYALPWKNQLVGDLEALEVPVHMIGSGRGLTPRAGLNLRTLLRDKRIDLLHAHSPTVGIMSRVISNVPVVYTEHNVVDSYRTMTRVFNRLTYPRNSAVVAVSDAVAESVTSWPGPSARVIPNGVAAHATEEERLAARAELGVPTTDRLVAHVGNIRPGKGHDNLIAATRLLVENTPNVTVVSIGGEKYDGDLERVRTQAEEAGLANRLHFLGRRPDALAFVAAADVFVSPSEVEGLPVAILEAMSLGKPVAATAVGGVPSIVHDGETGSLVAPSDPQALSEAIRGLLDDPEHARKIGEAGRELVESRHGLEPMIRATEQAYAQVLGIAELDDSGS